MLGVKLLPRLTVSLSPENGLTREKLKEVLNKYGLLPLGADPDEWADKLTMEGVSWNDVFAEKLCTGKFHVYRNGTEYVPRAPSRPVLEAGVEREPRDYEAEAKAKAEATKAG